MEYCRSHSREKADVFEVYRDPEVEGRTLVIVNSETTAEGGKLLPIGAFYCNYLGPGVISLDDENPQYDGMKSRKLHIAAVKRVVDLLLASARPGIRMDFTAVTRLED